jgi:hypothetical protein
MTGVWNDFNDAKQNSNLIPKGTIAKVRLTIRPGGFDDPSQGWTGGYARRGSTGSVYLDVEYTVLEGPHAKRKVWSMIGLYSPNGPGWGNMGRGFVRGVLNSARGLSDKDNSPEAQNARRISGLGDLDGIEFVARIDVGKDSNGEDKNEIRQPVTRDHKDYAAVIGGVAAPMAYAAPQPAYSAPPQQAAYTPPQQQHVYAAPQAQPPTYAPQQAEPAPSTGVRPTWAK